MTLQLRFPAERSSTSAGEGESEKAKDVIPLVR